MCHRLARPVNHILCMREDRTTFCVSRLAYAAGICRVRREGWTPDPVGAIVRRSGAAPRFVGFRGCGAPVIQERTGGGMGVLDFLTWWETGDPGNGAVHLAEGRARRRRRLREQVFPGEEPRRARRRRWVLYRGEVEGSKVPAEWHAWLHHTSDEPPSDPAPRRDWERPHIANLTGTRRRTARRGPWRGADGGIRRPGTTNRGGRIEARRLGAPPSVNGRASRTDSARAEASARQNWDAGRYARDARFVSDLGVPVMELLGRSPASGSSTSAAATAP